MTPWEYKIVECVFEMKFEMEILTEKGANGWELITVKITIVDGFRIAKFYFKRPVKLKAYDMEKELKKEIDKIKFSKRPGTCIHGHLYPSPNHTTCQECIQIQKYISSGGGKWQDENDAKI